MEVEDKLPSNKSSPNPLQRTITNMPNKLEGLVNLTGEWKKYNTQGSSHVQKFNPNMSLFNEIADETEITNFLFALFS